MRSPARHGHEDPLHPAIYAISADIFGFGGCPPNRRVSASTKKTDKTRLAWNGPKISVVHNAKLSGDLSISLSGTKTAVGSQAP